MIALNIPAAVEDIVTEILLTSAGELAKRSTAAELNESPVHHQDETDTLGKRVIVHND